MQWHSSKNWNTIHTNKQGQVFATVLTNGCKIQLKMYLADIFYSLKIKLFWIGTRTRKNPQAHIVSSDAIKSRFVLFFRERVATNLLFTGAIIESNHSIWTIWVGFNFQNWIVRWKRNAFTQHTDTCTVHTHTQRTFIYQIHFRNVVRSYHSFIHLFICSFISIAIVLDKATNCVTKKMLCSRYVFPFYRRKMVKFSQSYRIFATIENQTCARTSHTHKRINEQSAAVFTLIANHLWTLPSKLWVT